MKRFKRETIKRSALNRMGTPEDIAGAVYFLCSDDAKLDKSKL